MELQVARICCISYRDPLLWVVVGPLSVIAFLFGWRLVQWTVASGRLRWPLRLFGLLLGAVTSVVVAMLLLPCLSLLLSSGRDSICTHFVKPALLLPFLSSVTGAVWSASRTVARTSVSAS